MKSAAKKKTGTILWMTNMTLSTRQRTQMKIRVPKSETKATCSLLDIWKKSKWETSVRAGKGTTSFIANEDMDDIIKIVG